MAAGNNFDFNIVFNLVNKLGETVDKMRKDVVELAKANEQNTKQTDQTARTQTKLNKTLQTAGNLARQLAGGAIRQLNSGLRVTNNLLSRGARLARNFATGGLHTIRRHATGTAAALGLVVSAYGAIDQAGKTLDAAVQKQKIGAVIGTVFDEKQQEQLGFIKNEIERLGLNLKTVAIDYGKFAASAKESNLPLRETQKIYIATSEAGRALKLSNDQIHGTLVAVQQMLNKGVVSAEELRQQFSERLPGGYQVFVKASGLTSREFAKQLEQGKILSKDILPKVADLLHKTYGKRAQEEAGKYAANLERVNNRIFEIRAIVGTPVTGALNEILIEINQTAKDLIQSGRLEKIGEQIASVIRVIAGAHRAGQLSTLISLSIEAGFEQGLKLAKKLLGQSLKIFGSNLSNTIVFHLGKAVTFGISQMLDGIVSTGNFIKESWSDTFTIVAKTFVGIIIKGVNLAANGLLTLATSLNNNLPLNLQIEKSKLVELDILRSKLLQNNKFVKGLSVKPEVENLKETANRILDEHGQITDKLIGTYNERFQGLLTNSDELNSKNLSATERLKRFSKEILDNLQKASQTNPINIGSGAENLFGNGGSGAGGGGAVGADPQLQAFFEQMEKIRGSVLSTSNAYQNMFAITADGYENLFLNGGQEINILDAVRRTAIRNLSERLAAETTFLSAKLTGLLGFNSAEVAANAAKNSALVAQETAKGASIVAALTPAALLESIISWGVSAIIGAAVLTAVMAAFGGGGGGSSTQTISSNRFAGLTSGRVVGAPPSSATASGPLPQPRPSTPNNSGGTTTIVYDPLSRNRAIHQTIDSHIEDHEATHRF